MIFTFNPSNYNQIPEIFSTDSIKEGVLLSSLSDIEEHSSESDKCIIYGDRKKPGVNRRNIRGIAVVSQGELSDTCSDLEEKIKILGRSGKDVDLNADLAAEGVEDLVYIHKMETFPTSIGYGPFMVRRLSKFGSILCFPVNQRARKFYHDNGFIDTDYYLASNLVGAEPLVLKINGDNA